MIKVLLVIIGAAYTFLIGMFMMRKIDGWLDSGGLKTEKPGIEPVDIVIFGRDRLAFELCQMLREMKLEPVLVHELMFRREWKCAQYIIALSDSDVDNLSMCNIGKKFYTLKMALCICNEPGNKKLFQRAGIQVLERDNQTTAETIYEMITGEDDHYGKSAI